MIITTPITGIVNHDGKQAGTQTTGTLNLSALKPGQILNAITLTNSTNGLVDLKIGSANLTATTNVALSQHLQMSLKVMQLQPHVVLKLISLPNNPVVTGPLREALPALLPRQSGLAPVLADIMQVATTSARPGDSAELRTLANTLIKTIPSRATMTQADGVRQAIQQSGVFLEAKIAANVNQTTQNTTLHNNSLSNTQTNIRPTQISQTQNITSQSGQIQNVQPAIIVATDLKALLLRYLAVASVQPQAGASPGNQSSLTSALQQLLTDIPPPLKGRPPVSQPGFIHKLLSSEAIINADTIVKIQGALARLGLLQVATAENFNDNQTLWQLEIPVRHNEAIDIVSLTIEKENKNKSDNEEDDGWVIQIALDLPHLGPVKMRVSMNDEGVSSTFWAETPDTVSLIDSKLGKLKTSLEKHGITILNLGCRAGSPATKSEAPDTAIFDERA